MNKNFQYGAVRSAASTRSNVDAGLRSYLLRVYNYMSLGLGLTGVIAFLVSTSPVLLQTIHQPPLSLIVSLAPIGFALFLSVRINKIQAQTAQVLFWVFAGLMGLSLSYVFVLYTGISIAKVFFITSGTFGAMSLYGYTTKTDLSRFGSFLIMGLFGIIIASVVNMFLKSSGLEFITSFLGVVIFIGLTAYDTQNIKNSYYASAAYGDKTLGKQAIMGALTLYLDFINLFMYLLRFLGDRR